MRYQYSRNDRVCEYRWQTWITLVTGQGHTHSHGHSHGHDHSHGHGHGHKKKKSKHEFHELEEEGFISFAKKEQQTKTVKKPKKDLNVYAVFLHYLGDAISSLLVLVAGLLLHFYDNTWTHYIDPVARYENSSMQLTFISLVIIVFILVTTVPLGKFVVNWRSVRQCSLILLQKAPGEVRIGPIRDRLSKVEGVLGVHDLHVWEVQSGMTIASVHVSVEEGADFAHLLPEVRQIFHENGIHSTSVQPEFVPRNHRVWSVVLLTWKGTLFCEQNCINDCDEDWCCKKTAERHQSVEKEYSLEFAVWWDKS